MFLYCPEGPMAPISEGSFQTLFSPISHLDSLAHTSVYLYRYLEQP
jgi:hypothetical protein